MMGGFSEEFDEEFRWAINDGAEIARDTYLDFSSSGRYFSEIPFVDVFPGRESSEKQGLALNIASVVLEHTHKGKRGFVAVKNRDRDKYALIGGKVESLLDRSSDNLDAVSCIIREASEEIGTKLHPKSLVGVALTPKDFLEVPNRTGYRDNENSLMNICFYATAANPRQLDEVIENPEKYIPSWVLPRSLLRQLLICNLLFK